MHRPARLASSHRRRTQRRRTRLANPAARHLVSVVAADPATVAAAWMAPTGLPNAGLTTHKEPW